MEKADGLFGERARHGVWVLESSSAGALVVVPPAFSRQCPVRWVRCGARGSLLSAFCLVRRNGWDNGRLVGYVRVCGPASVELSPWRRLKRWKSLQVPDWYPVLAMRRIVDVLIVAN